MKEKHIHLVNLAVIGQNVLITDVCKSLTEFKKKLLNLLNQSPLKFQFKERLCYSKKSHTIGILEDLVGVCGLSLRECDGEII